MIKLPAMSRDLSCAIEAFNSADRVPIYCNVEDTDGDLELLIHGAVGDKYQELDSSSLVSLLAKQPERTILMRINSPGGSVFDGVAIHSALLHHKGQVTARIEGIAASAASFLTTAADTIEIAKAGSYMIHRAWGIAVGNAQAMTDMANVLTKLDDQIAGMYVDRTGKKPEEIMEWMIGDEDGTWFNAEEALEHGFVDFILPGSSRKYAPDEDDKRLAEHRHQVAARLNQIAVNERLQKITVDARRFSR